jgi:hypothetical protein
MVQALPENVTNAPAFKIHIKHKSTRQKEPGTWLWPRAFILEAG